MLDADISAQLQQYMTMLRRPITLTATLGSDAKSAEMRDLLQEVAGMSDKITFSAEGSDARVPSFALTRPDGEQHLRFAAIPLGHEFTSLVLALLIDTFYKNSISYFKIYLSFYFLNNFNCLIFLFSKCSR